MLQTLRFRSLMFVLLCQAAPAAVYNATPANFGSLLASLQPGDTLNLAAGTYPRFNLFNLNGNAAAWITIAGPASGAPATIAGASCCNTIEIRNSSYIAIKNLVVDSKGLDGIFGVSANGGSANLVHHILLEGNTFVGQNGSQQTVAISTKAPTWGWIIRRNVITGAGTGVYLGNSDGTQPFVAGVIENNLIQNTLGYNLQIKYQLPRPAVSGMPTGPSSTIIRNNVFIKDDQVSPDGDRPNVFLGGFPESGPGSTDLYEVYGNFFFHNPREALLQAEGRLSVHDNIFVDGQYAAAVFRSSTAPLKLAHVYNNTVYSQFQGIDFGSLPSQSHAVTGNLVFAATPIAGQAVQVSNNIVDGFANAGLYVKSPSLTLGAMDFYPLAGKALGPALDLSAFSDHADYLLDFNSVPKTAARNALVYRGAYAGEGANPGWRLQAALKGSGVSVLYAFSCAPAAITLGETAACQINLSAPAPPSAVVSVSSNGVLLVPSTVTVPAGATTAAFTASTQWATGTGVLTARWNGVSRTATAVVWPLPRPASVSCSQSTLFAGDTANCQVTLTAAPLSPVSVALKSNAAGLGVPVSVTVAGGATSAAFTATAAPFASYQTGSITATLNGYSAAAPFTVQPALPTSQPKFQLDGAPGEFPVLTTGSPVLPSVIPAGAAASLVIRGTGAVTFVPVTGPAGVSFSRGGQQNANTAFVQVSAPQLAFDSAHGDIMFDLKSSYSFAERAASAATYRFAFDVDDGAKSQFYFYTVVSSGRLAFAFNTAGSLSEAYYVPAGTEDAWYGKGIALKVRIVWDGSYRSLYLNDVNVTGARPYSRTAFTWSPTAMWSIASRAPAVGAGYYALDDAVASLQIR